MAESVKLDLRIYWIILFCFLACIFLPRRVNVVVISLSGRNHKVEGDSVQELSVRLLATLCNCKDREAEDARDQVKS